jgi:hypothetical protein
MCRSGTWLYRYIYIIGGGGRVKTNAKNQTKCTSRQMLKKRGTKNGEEIPINGSIINSKNRLTLVGCAIGENALIWSAFNRRSVRAPMKDNIVNGIA